MRLNAPRAHLDATTKSTGMDRGCVRSTSRTGTARPGVFGQLSDSGYPHLLRLVLRTQPRSGGGSKIGRVRGPGLQDVVGRVPSRGGTFCVTYKAWQMQYNFIAPRGQVRRRKAL